MAETQLARTANIFTSRLATLGRLLDAAETQSPDADGVDALLGARVAPDMYPLPYQIVFTCDQARQFAAWCQSEAFERTDPTLLDWQALKRHVADTIAQVDRVATLNDDALLARDKRVDLIDGMYLELSAADYRDEWLMPNFYFHLVTAYDILRMKGVAIGKADYMGHLVDRIRRAPAN